MTRYGLFLVIELIVLLAFAPIHVQAVEPVPYKSPICQEWSMDIDFLYWAVRKNGLDFAAPGRVILGTEPVLGPGKTSHAEPKYDFGVRTSLSKEYDCGKFGARYIHYSNKAISSFFANNTDADEGAPMRTHPDNEIESEFDIFFAKSRYKIDMQIFDLEYARVLRPRCRTVLSLFGGVKFAFINQSLKTTYLKPAGDVSFADIVRERNDMNAYGLFFGTEIDQCVCNPMGVYARLSVATLSGRFTGSFIEQNSEREQTIIDVNICDIADSHVSCFEIGTGIEITFCTFGCINWNARIGYDFNLWLGMSDFINFVNDDIEGHPSRDKDSLGYDGISIRLRAMF